MKRLIFFSLILCLSSCYNSSEKTSSDYRDMGNSAAVPESYTDNATQSEAMHKEESALRQGDKIIRSGQLTFVVDKLEESKTRINSLLDKYKAYYESENFETQYRSKSYHLLIRIPQDKFSLFITDLESGLGKLSNKSINARDVTEEYVDLNIRLENNLAYLAQYQDILKKASSIKEILEIKEKIRQIEEEIESRKGRLKFLDNQVNYASLSIELKEFVSDSSSTQVPLSTRITNAFKNGVEGFVDFFIGLISWWPFLLILLLLLFYRKRIWAIFKRK